VTAPFRVAGGDALATRRVSTIVRRLPPLAGAPVRVRFQPSLFVHRRRLTHRPLGTEVHAATCLRKREMVLETALLRNTREFARIFLHEVFHFVWLRLGNAGRQSYEALLAAEIGDGAAGELGWSAEWRKRALGPHDRLRRSRRWREYVCESFCDSAAWSLLPDRRHEEFTLEARFRLARRAFFARFKARPVIRI